MALHRDGLSWTFDDLGRRVRAVSRACAQVSGAGDRIAMVTWDGVSAIEALVGVPRAGRVVAPISPRSTPGEIDIAAATAKASLLIVDDDLVAADALTRLATHRRVLTSSQWNQAIESAEQADLEQPEADIPDAVAWLMFTSGTTGAPRAAALSHTNILAAVRTTATVRPLAADDRYLYPFPHWHIAIYNVLCRLLAGRPVILHPRFDPERLIDEVERTGATSISLAATMLDALATTVESGRRRAGAMSSLRQVFYGAAPMPVSVLQRGAHLFDVEWWQGYGMTETSGNLVFLGPADHRTGLSDTPHMLRATGRPAAGVEVRIVDEDGSVVPPDTPGEVQVRSEQIFVGYWGDPAASEAALTSDGWLNTGDVGKLDPTGLLWLIDRKKDIIITGGENVSAREVEEVLRAWPPVVDVAVVGVPDEKWGENVCAVVVVRSGTALNVDALIRHTRQQLAGFKVPRHIVETSALPVNASGKVVKTELRRWLLDNASLLGERR